eukprot:CAMPEP_0171462112 /NCGR_PEP_ID=MMETSP0945-20130129/6285_1 /TAXON_ID=109269 /ORGANISM="Vaucheria litorea, Strain CCMP2940" /LENGTH=420 /DNA_ID=CAMNT_0011988583 /DNA_START=169 /DNA_END=1428 /DNA_ORIENTATION=+
MPSDVSTIVNEIYQKSPPPRLYICTTGAGGMAISWLMGVPGASASIQEAIVPYSYPSLENFSKLDNESFGLCSKSASVSLAEESYKRSLEISIAEFGLSQSAIERSIGIGCSAAIASVRPKKGLHRCFISAKNSKGISTFSMNLSKGQRSRIEEEEVVSKLMIKAIAAASEVNFEGKIGFDLKDGDTMFPTEIDPSEDPLDLLMKGKVEKVFVLKDEKSGFLDKTLAEIPLPKPSLVLPGSFNPLHEGHIGLLQAAQRCLMRTENEAKFGKKISKNLPMIFELAVENADKGTLSKNEVLRRKDQFKEINLTKSGEIYSLALTKATLFLQKARLFPGCVFVVGADTVSRILNPKYYLGGSVAEMVIAIAEIKYLNCKIIVGGRLKSDKAEFETLLDILDDSLLPESLRGIFLGLKEDDFRV